MKQIHQHHSFGLSSFFLGGLFLIALGAVLQSLKGILAPFLIALFLLYLFEPLQKLMIRYKLPLALRIFVILSSTLFTMYLIVAFLISNLMNVGSRLEGYVNQLLQKIRDWESLLPIETLDLGAFLNAIDWSKYLEGGAAKILGFGIEKSGGLFVDVGLILIYMLYMLFERESFFSRIQRAFEAKKAEKIGIMLNYINQQIAAYLEVKIFVSLGTATLVTLLLKFLEVDLALLWGALTFLLNFIPSIGSIIATIPPVITVLLQFQSPTLTIVVALVLGAIQVTIGSIIEPKIMGNKLGLSPLVVLLSLVFWGWIWGPIGMILAAPVMSMIRIVCDNIPTLRPISVFMSEKS